MDAIPNPFLTIFGIGRGRAVDHGLFAVGNARLPSDAIGTATVSFLGVSAGSEIRVYLSDMTELAGIESCAADQVLSWDSYPYGNPNNTVRIVIIHPDYKIKEFTYLSQVGNQTIPVQQEPDKWYSNPA